MSKASLRVTGHTLIPKKWAKDVFPKLFRETRAFCSCGAWDNNLTLMSYSQWSRKWHDNHKIDVLRSRGELEEEQ
jgi:hypothetical protein